MTHQPRASFQSPRFAQPATFMRLPHVEDPRGLDVAIVGVPYDGGTSYRPGARLGLANRHGPLALVQSDSHIDTWHDHLGGKRSRGMPFRRAIEEGVMDGRRFIKISIRGPMYGEEDFEFHREHGITLVDIDQVK